MVDQPVSAGTAARKLKTVLIVDDNPDLRELLRISVERGPYQTLLACDGDEGLRMAAAEQPDLILLDVELPTVDGFTVCRRLKSDDATSSIRVLMLTAAVQEENRERALAAGADGYITKPFSLRFLMERLAAEIG